MTDSESVTEVAAGPAVSFGFNLAKVPDHGEDSDPILRDGPDLGLAAVFDGMGGAGGTVYETDDGPRSGAYLASRVARDAVEERMLALLNPDRPLAGDPTATELHDVVEAALQAELERLDAPVSRLRSRLLRALPTTMALAALQRVERGGSRWACHVLWAGDSRVYALTSDGMHQLSLDDLRDPGDAMENLRRDSVISNAMSADTEFVVRHRRVVLDGPFVLVCATDGCFGYLRTPMHFEATVLRALARASTDETWSTGLQAEIAAVTGDDASMAVIGVGADLETLQRVTAPRLAQLEEQYTVPMDGLLDEVDRAERALLELQQRRADDTAERWSRYRGGYERFFQDAGDAEPVEAPEPQASPIWNPVKRIGTGPIGAGPAPESGADLLVTASTDGEVPR